MSVYSPVHKATGFFKQKSVDRSAGNKAPSLPREGAQKRAQQIKRAADNNNQDFMKTPDAGMAGYVSGANIWVYRAFKNL